ncbi:hypothetical protein [Nannocystis exedens]|uniref:hypothetical protein n=1 Tax=Nannocystis exedens TaxID=54 RepID=UPI0011609E62|nr:hypothetical protein [Nannocystis exedens]
MFVVADIVRPARVCANLLRNAARATGAGFDHPVVNVAAPEVLEDGDPESRRPPARGARSCPRQERGLHALAPVLNLPARIVALVGLVLMAPVPPLVAFAVLGAPARTLGLLDAILRIVLS